MEPLARVEVVKNARVRAEMIVLEYISAVFLDCRFKPDSASRMWLSSAPPQPSIVSTSWLVPECGQPCFPLESPHSAVMRLEVSVASSEGCGIE